ncbi:MAG: hypothetical protein BGP24_09380 [Lysobacterales bacterium 69-70]|nr:hypothetical protein [Xanthomonadaceae bacterium]ODU33171.1 MAG: hypothetical protein ABS97_12405 [Xanthomonadaceae bacterium SCN 69-320]ODV20502.1 MAG: hypothetical protein ABT27_07265 [Xanthomonadaceae bacterium SCN 69-25]OJZ00716.1 MAG: hypothetical protein BGP24_09380 [Xanthomonadales bacterium 69-70]
MNDSISERDAPKREGNNAAAPPNGGSDGKEGGITATMFWAGLIGGTLIMATSFIALGLDFAPPLVSILIICSGLAIVLCVFGSKASDRRVKGLAIGGALAASCYLFHTVTDRIQMSVVKIDISGITRGASVDLFSSSDQQIFGAPRRKSYQFIAFADDLDSKWLSLDIVLAATPDLPEGREILFDCVPRSAIDRHLGSRETVQWRVDMDKGELVAHGSSPVLIARVGPCRNDAAMASPTRWPSLIATAYAQAPANIAQSLRDLDADSTALRREARKALAAQGSDGVKPIMQQWTVAKDSYRVRLGSTVALAEMLRSRQDDRKAVGAQLSDNDLELITQTLSDQDRTVRVYAGEFLTDLGDKRLAPIALQQLRTASDEGQYQLALVLESVVPELSPTERDRLRSDLALLRADGSLRLGPQTRQKLDAVANAK